MGLKVDCEPGKNFGAEGLIEISKLLVTPEARILRLRSDKAGPALSEDLRGRGATVDDCVLYHNEPIEYDSRPSFDAVFFASASAVEVFDSNWGRDQLNGKTVVAIGKPTHAALKRVGVDADVIPAEATLNASIEALAGYCVSRCVAER